MSQDEKKTQEINQVLGSIDNLNFIITQYQLKIKCLEQDIENLKKEIKELKRNKKGNQ